MRWLFLEKHQQSLQNKIREPWANWNIIWKKKHSHKIPYNKSWYWWLSLRKCDISNANKMKTPQLCTKILIYFLLKSPDIMVHYYMILQNNKRIIYHLVYQISQSNIQVSYKFPCQNPCELTRQTWHLIGWQHSRQPIKSHVRKSLLTNM